MYTPLIMVRDSFPGALLSKRARAGAQLYYILAHEVNNLILRP
jgi:hypothetical protein